MAGNATSKARLLRLLEIFQQQTDEDHPMDAGALLSALEGYGLEAERKAIYRDVEAMQDCGMDIVLTGGARGGYFLGERTLQLAELRLLVDAVLAAGFITPKKSGELIDKLLELCSRHQARELRRQIYIDHRNKQQNEEIYYNINEIHRAVTQGKKITFRYGRRVLDERGAVKPSLRTFTVSPYALLWFDDRYYLIGNHEKYDDLMHLRVDRMRSVRVEKEPCRSFEEVSDYRGYFDVADYAGRLSNAFGGEPVWVELRCRDDLLEAMLDRFGDDLTVRRCAPGRFRFRVKAAFSEGLVHDLLNFGDGVEVLSPPALRQQMADAVGRLARVYAAGEKNEK